MNTARLLGVLAASSLAGIAYAQSQAQTQPQTQTQAAGSNTSKPSANPGPRAAASPHQNQSLRMAEAGAGGHSWTDMPVESPSGQSLGSVANVVPGLNGEQSSGYVVVYGANGMSVPVPYRTASSMVRNGKLVLSQSMLEHAPKATQEDLQSSSNPAWRVKADRYWMHRGHGRKRKQH